MSEEIIKVLDALADKVGLTIDWTSANVLPYLQKLCDKYVTYEICTSVVWILIGICLLLAGKYMIEKAKYFWQKFGEDKYSNYDIGTILFYIFAGCVVIPGVIIISCQIFDIVTCVTFPEKIIIEELKLIYLSIK